MAMLSESGLPVGTVGLGKVPRTRPLRPVAPALGSVPTPTQPPPPNGLLAKQAKLDRIDPLGPDALKQVKLGALPKPQTPATPTPGTAVAAGPGAIVERRADTILPPGGAAPPAAAATAPAQTPEAARIAAGATAPADPNQGITEFGPGNDLRSAQIAPTASERLLGMGQQTNRARELTAQGLENLSSAPDRQTLARKSLEDFISSTDPGYQQRLRESADRAASLGRVGSGMAADDITRLGRGREAEIIQQSRELAGETAGRELEDRAARLSAAQGVAGQFGEAESGQFGREAAQRGELRGERGYQGDTAQQAITNRANQVAMEAALQQQEFGQNLARGQFASGVADVYGEQGERAQDAGAEAIRAAAVQRSLGMQPTGTTAAAPASTPQPGTAAFNALPPEQQRAILSYFQ